VIERPRLIIVGGAPGAGKTTLAERLSQELGLPLLAKDRLKEPLMDVLGVPDLATQRRIGQAAYGVLYEVARALLESKVGCIIESNFVTGRSEAGLRPLLKRTRPVQLVCVCDESLRRARYEERARSGGRHPGHMDNAVLGEWTARTPEPHLPLDLGVPLLVVDTSNDYRPSFEDIVAFVQ
jgi:predicted kinase